jgi:AcrR family transcriptional regulator
MISGVDLPVTFDRIADFHFVRLLGSGSFAQTFEAVRGKERFAVKVLNELPASVEARERFNREVASLRIEHPNLAEYVQSGIAPCAGRPAAFIAMRYLPGRSLREAGVGIGTLYRHYPTRPALLAALTLRSFNLVLDHARAAALSDEPAPATLAQFFEQTIAERNELILPLHGGPVIDDEKIVALRTEIRNLLEQVLARGRRDRTIRPDATPIDIIITGAMLAQPLPHAADWDQLARRQARIFVAGLAAADTPLPGSRPTRARR